MTSLWKGGLTASLRASSVLRGSPALASLRETATFPVSLLTSADDGAFWLPNDTSSVSSPVGSAVSDIIDLGPFGRNLTQPTLANRGLLAAPAGVKCVQFDGANDYYTGGDTLDLMSGSYWAVFAVKFDTAVDQAVFAKSRAADAASRYALLRVGGNLTSLADLTTNVGVDKATADASTVIRVVALKLDRQAGVNRLRINGVTQVPDTSFAGESGTSWNSANHFLLGAYADAGGINPLAGLHFDGEFYGGFIKLTDDMSGADAEIAQVEAYFADLLGL